LVVVKPYAVAYQQFIESLHFNGWKLAHIQSYIQIMALKKLLH